MSPAKPVTVEPDHTGKIPRGHAWLPLFVAGFGIAAYLNSFSGAFVYDDEVHIHNNPRIRHLWPPWEVLSGRRPVVDLTLALNYALGDIRKVWGYHALNLSVHIPAAITLYGIIRRTLLRDPFRNRRGRAAPWLATVVATIWVVHPLQTQSVTYIIQRGESLMGLFYLLTLYCVIRGVDGRRKLYWYVTAVVCCALGMGSKAVIVTCPLMVLLYDWVFVTRSLREALARRWGLYLGLTATASILVLSGVATGVLDPTPKRATAMGFAFKGITPLEYALTQPGVLLYYLRLSVWPRPLCLDYAWPVASTAWAIVPPTLVIAALLAGAVWALFRKVWIGFVGAWFFVILLPTSSVIPIKDTLLEHRIYLSLASVILLIVLGGYTVLEHLFGREAWSRWIPRLTAGGLVLGVVVGLGLMTRDRNEDYHSSVTLWRDVITKRPNNARGYLNYAAVVGDVREATRALREALRLKPDYADAHYNLGMALNAVGKLDESIEAYRTAVRHDPRHARAYYNLGNALTRKGQIDASIDAYRQAVRADPRHYKAWFNLGQALFEQGKPGEAVRHLRAALEIEPQFLQGYASLAAAFIALGKFDEAGEAYRAALEIQPDEYNFRFELGLVLARQGRIDEAMQQFRETLRLNPNHSGAREALRAAWNHKRRSNGG